MTQLVFDEFLELWRDLLDLVHVFDEEEDDLLGFHVLDPQGNRVGSFLCHLYGSGHVKFADLNDFQVVTHPYQDSSFGYIIHENRMARVPWKARLIELFPDHPTIDAQFEQHERRYHS
jgi:hypothetical protein